MSFFRKARPISEHGGRRVQPFQAGYVGPIPIARFGAARCLFITSCSIDAEVVTLIHLVFEPKIITKLELPMASISYIKNKKQWRIRKHITDPLTGKVSLYDKILPKLATRQDAAHVAAGFDQVARQIKLGRFYTPDTIASVVSAWLVLMRCRTSRTLDLYRHNIGRFIASLPLTITHVHQIQPSHIFDFIAAITERWSPATANRYLAVIKSFCRWFSRRYSLSNPSSAVDMLPEPNPQTRFLTQAEFDLIIASARESTIDTFLFLANTGLRASEFCGLRWSNIADDLQSLTLAGKGRKKRIIPLNAFCRDVLKKIRPPQITPDTPVFISKSDCLTYKGRPSTRGGLYNTCAAVARRCGIPAFGPHAFRHWFATQLLLRGVPIAHVSLLLGHSSISTTQRHYIHILPGHLAGITECLGRPLSSGMSGGEASLLGEKFNQGDLRPAL